MERPYLEHALQDVAFPRLSDLKELERCAEPEVRHYEPGEALFRAGDREFQFYVVRRGEVEVVDPACEPPRVLTVHGPGQFTGDVSHLTGSPALVSAVARVDTEVLAVTSSNLRRMLDRCLGLSDVILQAFIARRQLLRQSGLFAGVRVIGSRYSRDTFRIRDFLARNRVPYIWLDVEAEPAVKQLLEKFSVSEAETPVVALGSAIVLRNPSNEALADALGIRRPLTDKVFDLAIVGSGPAGLAAAVYGASEGLSTAVLERLAPGGQAGGTMRIENYLGFPTGVSGGELAERAVIQAHRFGAQLSVPFHVIRLSFENRYAVLHQQGQDPVTAKCLIIATGAEYRRLVAEGCEPFEGNGVFYAATANEAPLCQGKDVAVVGAGNSAGQAAVYLATVARQVYLLVRGDDLGRSMSSYLVTRIQNTPNITVLTRTVVRRNLGGCPAARRGDRGLPDRPAVDPGGRGAVQLHRRRATVRMAPRGNRA